MSFWGAGVSFWSNFGGMEPHLGKLGVHFGAILGVRADSGSQARLGRRPGRLLGDFIGLYGPQGLGRAVRQHCLKMASSWGPDRTKIDANIDRNFDVFENRNLDGKS